MAQFTSFGGLLAQRCAPATALLLASCAGPLYIHSPSMEKAAASAAAALPNETDALKAFDEQLANLDRFAADEDLAASRYWTGARDAHFVRLIAMDRSIDRSRRLTQQVDRRLVELTGSAQIGDPIDPAAAMAQKSALESFANSQRRAYARAEGAVPDRDLTCKTAIAAVSQAEADRLVASGNSLDAPVGQIARFCRAIAHQDAIINQLATADGAIGEAIRAAAAATKQEETDLSDRADALKQQIDRAETFAEKEASVVQLRAFADDVKKLLVDATAGAKAVGWEKAGEGIDKILKAQVCSSDAVDEAAKTEAKCGDVTPTSTTGRIVATWGLAKALAQLADASDQRRRSVNWLLAAKAIIAAETADATLGFEEAKAVAAAHRKRLEFLQREAIYLGQAKRSATGPRGDCHRGLVGGDTGPNPHCQFASYVDSWNEGRIPAQILDYRPIQVSRTYAVKRQRAIARKQHVVAAAATATLKDYGARGLSAAIIGQALFDAALLGVGIGDL
jgi:hypothetical protein